MIFPVYFHLFGYSIAAHTVFESLAYVIGARIYFATRPKTEMPADKRIPILVGAILGAAFGSKLLSYFENPWAFVQHMGNLTNDLGGKTIVGGLLGGLIGVEWAKRRVGWRRSTGDTFVVPLTVGMCIGRIGCFLGGIPDHTYGTPTRLFTGVNFGDGIPRHPTQLYEVAFLILWLVSISGLTRLIARKSGISKVNVFPAGTRFQMFMVGYLMFRFLIDFIKPTPHPYLGFNNIQVAAIFGLMYYVPKMRHWFSRIRQTKFRPEVEHA